MAAKRPRSVSQSSASSWMSVGSHADALDSSALVSPPSPPTKFGRRDGSAESSNVSALTCTLPPTCHLSPQSFSSRLLLTSHQRTFHSHICTATHWTIELESSRAKAKQAEGVECRRVFPDEWMLGLHFTECHDVLAKLRQEKGEKIFACFLPTCRQLFSSPKSRRLHLIAKHGYAREYFFGVTLHGVEEVLGKGGGMVKKPWRAREGQRQGQAGSRSGRSTSGSGRSESPEVERAKSRDAGQEGMTADAQGVSLTPRTDTVTHTDATGVDGLTAAMGRASIGLVPRSVTRKKKEKEKKREATMES